MADLESGYNIIERIGTGARSTIFKVVDPKTGESFALKRVIREPHEDTRFLEQACTEHDIASQTNHAYLRKSYEIKKIRRMLRLTEVQVVMEYVQGVSIEQHRPTEMTEIVAIFLKVAEGLDSLHKIGYLHTDLKPNNILVCLDGSIKIIDFGQGCLIGTRKPRIQGTPDYIAPEQVHRKPLTQRTDIFNLGATLYWVLTGRAYPTLISKTSPARSLNLVAAPRGVPSPQELNDKVPAPLSRLVMESCQERPQDRPRDMKLVINRLEAVHHLLNRTQRDDKKGPPAERPKDDKDEEHEPHIDDETSYAGIDLSGFGVIGDDDSTLLSAPDEAFDPDRDPHQEHKAARKNPDKSKIKRTS